MSVQLPIESTRGTESLFADAAIAFPFALVKTGSDDRHVAATANVADIPRGVVMHDTVSSDDVANGIKKTVAILGMYPETLPVPASAPIAAGAQVVADPANPGQVKQLPAVAGTYIVVGRARFAVVTAGDPVSLIHQVPVAVTIVGA